MFYDELHLWTDFQYRRETAHLYEHQLRKEIRLLGFLSAADRLMAFIDLNILIHFELKQMIKPLTVAVCTLCFLIIHFRSQLPENRLDMVMAVDYLKVDQAGR